MRGGDKNRPVRYGNGYIYFGGDIITAVGETDVRTFSDLFGALENTRPGETVSVTVVRGKEEKKFDVLLSDRTFTLQ